MNKLAQQRYRYMALTLRVTLQKHTVVLEASTHMYMTFANDALGIMHGEAVIGSCRARQRQNLQNLQTKQSDYAQTVEKLEQVNLSNRDLEVEKHRLEAELSQLKGVQHIKPSAPANSNGYSDSDSNNSSTGPAVFTTRVGRDIIVEPAHAVKYRKTEQLWFSKVKVLA